MSPPSDREADRLIDLALACRDRRDGVGQLVALDRLLATSPNHLGALLMKADYFAATGDGRSAETFYSAVVARAPPPHLLPPAVRVQVDRARARITDYRRAFERHLVDAVEGCGAPASPRFAEALDLLLGKKEVHLQQPTSFYFPQMPQRPFYERDEFPWVGALEAQTAAIREELLAVMAEDGAFRPYIQDDPLRPPGEFGTLKNNPDWSAYFLINGGALCEEAIAHCPRTMAALRAVPLTDAAGRTPSILFSLLKPGARIQPHHGQINARLICHLPLIAPPDCALRVGNETRRWVAGETLIFDDSIEHEAWNNSGETRVILLFEVWRPELTAAERKSVATLLSAVDTYGKTEANA